MRGNIIQSTPSDFFLEVARGNIPGMYPVNRFGHAPDGMQLTATDVWDLANATPTQQIWVAPTTARIHQITSTSTSDDGAPVGVGARTIEIFGLTGWGANEVSETLTMNGTTDVPTANAYVIIHRMRILTKGATNVNVGQITATADTDSSITAVILAGQGQTGMAILGIPSTQKFYIEEVYGSIGETGGSAAAIDLQLLVNPEPDAELLNFRHEHTYSVTKSGSSSVEETFHPPKEIVGPAIIKVQGLSSAADQDVDAGFDGILVDN